MPRPTYKCNFYLDSAIDPEHGDVKIGTSTLEIY